MNEHAHDDFDATPMMDVDDAISELLGLVSKFKTSPMYMKGIVGEELGQQAVHCLKTTMSQTAQQQREITHLRDRQAVLKSQVESLTNIVQQIIEQNDPLVEARIGGTG